MRIATALALLTGLLSLQDPKASPPTLPAVGESAPVFRLNDHEGKTRQVGGETAEWTVLAFFPKAATPG